MSTPTEITKKIQEICLRVGANDMKLTGLRQEFAAACLSGDNERSENVRLEMHTLMDSILDDTYSSMRYLRQQMGAGNG